MRGAKGLKDVESVAPAGKLVPKAIASKLTGRRLAAGRLATGTFALGADAVAAGSIHAQQKAKQPIAKLDIGGKSVQEMAKGFLLSTRRTIGHVLGNGDSAAKTAKVAGRVGDNTADAVRTKANLGVSSKPKAAQAKTAAAGTGSPAAGAAPASTAMKIGQGLGTGASALAGTPKRAAATAVVGTTALAVNAHAKSNQAGYYTQPAYYSKRDTVWEGTFAKLDEDKHLAFGWANVCKIDGQLVTDHQGDEIVPEDLEDAAYEYVLTSGTGGDMHLRTDGRDVYPQEKARPGDKPVPVARVVESMMFTAEKKAALGLPDEFPEGWWIGMKYSDPKVWADIKEGRRSGFSIHGSGMRVPVDAVSKSAATSTVKAVKHASTVSLSHPGRLMALGGGAGAAVAAEPLTRKHQKANEARAAAAGGVAGWAAHQVAPYPIKHQARRQVGWNKKMSELEEGSEEKRTIKAEQKMRGEWQRRHKAAGTWNNPASMMYRDFPAGHRRAGTFRAMGHTHGGRTGEAVSLAMTAGGAAIGAKMARDRSMAKRHDVEKAVGAGLVVGLNRRPLGRLVATGLRQAGAGHFVDEVIRAGRSTRAAGSDLAVVTTRPLKAVGRTVIHNRVAGTAAGGALVIHANRRR